MRSRYALSGPKARGSSRRMRNLRFQFVAKRLVDVAASLVLLKASLPVLAVVALLIRWKMGRPVFFRQQRSGKHGRPFTLYKFRTMSNARGPNGEALPDAQRLTPLGRFAALQPRRASAIVERIGRPPEPGRAAALVAAVSQSLHARTGPAARRHPRHHWLGPSERAKRHFVGREVPARRLVRRSLERFGLISASFCGRSCKCSAARESAPKGTPRCQSSAARLRAARP